MATNNNDVIELRENNLYRNGEVIVFDGSDEMLLIRKALELKGTLEDEYHEVTYYDRIDLIAFKYYSDYVEDASKYWWAICDANDIIEPLDLTPYIGQQILIPNILNVLLML